MTAAIAAISAMAVDTIHFQSVGGNTAPALFCQTGIDYTTAFFTCGMNETLLFKYPYRSRIFVRCNIRRA